MRKQLLTLVLSCLAGICLAQNYYAEDAVITVDDITFSVRSIYGAYYEIENIQNKLTSAPTEFLDGSPAGSWEYEPGELDVETFKKAFTETFTEEEGTRLRDEKAALWVMLVKNNRGEVLEVRFSARVSPSTGSITPAKFALYEKNLKKYVRWQEITEDEKKLKFMQETRKLILPYLVPRKLREPDPHNPIDSLQAIR